MTGEVCRQAIEKECTSVWRVFHDSHWYGRSLYSNTTEAQQKGGTEHMAWDQVVESADLMFRSPLARIYLKRLYSILVATHVLPKR